MAKKKIKVVISASDEASKKVNTFNNALTTSAKIADASASAYDRMSALSNRLQLNTLRLADAQRRLSIETDPMKQAQLRVEIDNLAKSQDMLQKEIHESADAISDMGGRSKDVKVLGLSLTDLRSGISLVTGVAQTLGQTAKQVFDFTEEGASVIQTRKSFDRLGVSLEAMRGVSLNTIDDMTLMKATLTLTAGASEDLQAQLLENAPKLLEIAKAANAVNPTLGTTAQMYESIATGIKRSSPLILDNLGIVVKVEEANRTYAAALGKTTEELTAADKQMALLNATVLAGDRLIEQAGGTVESYGDAWAQLRVEIKNNTDAMKAQSAEAFGPLLRRYTEFLKANREADQGVLGFGASLRMLSFMLTEDERAITFATMAWKALTLQGVDLGKMITAYGEDLLSVTDKEERAGDAAFTHANKVKILSDELAIEIQRLERMARIYPTVNALTSNVSTLQVENANALRESNLAWNQYSDALERNEVALGKQAEAEIKVREAAARAKEARLLQNQGEANKILAEVRSNLTEKLDEGASSLEDLRSKQAEVSDEIERLTASHGRAIITQRESTLTEAEASLVTLQLAAAQAKLSEETDPLKQAQLTVQIENLNGKLGEAAGTTTTFVNNTKKIDELKGKYTTLTGEIDGTRQAITETIQAFMISQMQSTFALEGWTDAEVKVFTDTAVAFGFMDEQHAKLITKIETEDQLIDEVGETREQALRNAEGVTNRLLGVQKNVAWEYSRIETSGVGALQNLELPTQKQSLLMRELEDAVIADAEQFVTFGLESPIEIQKVEQAAGHAVEQLKNIASEAGNAQTAIDKMHGKSITLDIHINEHRQVGTSTPRLTTEELIDINQASGGDYTVTKPTMFIAGEGNTPERALFIPQGRQGFDGAVASQAMGGGSGTSIQELNIFVNGTADAQETARLVMREFQGRGWAPQVPLR